MRIVCLRVPSHALDIEQHLLRLDDDSRLMRFGGLTSDDAIRAHVRTLCLRNHGFVGVGMYDDGGTLRGICELGRDDDGVEIAVSVERPWQGRGVGTALCRHAVEIAEDIGSTRVYAFANNAYMRRIMLALGGEYDRQMRAYVLEVERPAGRYIPSRRVFSGAAFAGATCG